MPSTTPNTDRQEETVIIHTDSKCALQVLQQHRPQEDNVRLTTTILAHIQSLAAQGRRMQLNWVPSHVGLLGNEIATNPSESPQ